ncbi:MAG TPA: hypothetical protein VMR89_03490 [Actinomycetota bacterium]|nr:hypothetical protein [Actinomycetota bacterium]
MRFRAIVATAVLGTLLIGGTVLPVLARDGDVIRRRACSRNSDWKLKLSEENGRIEVEYEVDQNDDGDDDNSGPGENSGPGNSDDDNDNSGQSDNSGPGGGDNDGDDSGHGGDDD